MPTITINTTTLASGISYAWDLHWDAKTIDEVIWEFNRLLARIAKFEGVREACEDIERLAAKDRLQLRNPAKVNQARLKLRVPFSSTVPVDEGGTPVSKGWEKYHVEDAGQARHVYSRWSLRLKALERLEWWKNYMEELAAKDGFSLYNKQLRRRKK